MKSNVKYFFRKSLITTAASLCYAGLMFLIMTDTETTGSEYVYTCLMSFAIMNMAWHIAIYKTDIPMAISFGSTRSNLFKGLVLYDVLCCLLAGISCMLAAVILSPAELKLHFLCIILIGMLGTNVVGTIMGIMIYKLGKIAAIIWIIVCSLLIGIGVGFVVIFIRESIKGFLAVSTLIIITVVIAAFWIAVLFVQNRILRNYAL